MMLQLLRRLLRTSALLFKEANTRILKRGCLIRKYYSASLREAKFVDLEKVDGLKLTHDCEMA